jgi:DNA-binding NarL/FixJ family response regulator
LSRDRLGVPLVLIGDDDAGFCAFVAEILGSAGYETQTAGTGKAVLEATQKREPDLLLLDVHLEGLSGYEVCRRLRDRLGDTLPILIVSGERIESFDRVAGLIAGGDDYLVKPFADDELLARVRGLLSRSEAARRSNDFDLTEREREVLELLAEGLNPAQIAEELTISRKTVATHIEHIYGKLGAHSQAHAVGLAYRHNLLRTERATSLAEATS